MEPLLLKDFPGQSQSNEEGLENLARYIIRASFPSGRMTYIPACDTKSGSAKAIYRSKSDASSKTFDALDWLAQLNGRLQNRLKTARFPLPS